MHSNAYTLTFAAVITIVCGLILGGASQGLKEKQVINADVDVKSKVLMAFGEYKTELKSADVLSFFADGFDGTTVEQIAIDQDGKLVEIKEGEKVVLRKEIKKADKAAIKYPLYVLKKAGAVEGYAFPIQGAGLWSICHGFLALEADAKTIKGIIYYEHAETPGLGGEIADNQSWVDQFKGKSILNEKGELAPPQSTKVAEEFDSPNKYWAISGATFTLDGVNAMLTEYSAIYDKYLSVQRKEAK